MIILGILIGMILVVLLLPVIFPIRDEEIEGIMFQDPSSHLWLVCLTDRTMPVTFAAEAEAKAFLQESITYPVGG